MPFFCCALQDNTGSLPWMSLVEYISNCFMPFPIQLSYFIWPRFAMFFSGVSAYLQSAIADCFSLVALLLSLESHGTLGWFYDF